MNKYVLLEIADGLIGFKGLFNSKKEAEENKSINDKIYILEITNSNVLNQYILIKAFGLLFEEITIFEDKDSAIQEFQNYTNVEYSLIESVLNGESDKDVYDILDNYDQTQIIEIQI